MAALNAELNDKLQNTANNDQVLIMSFIAPDSVVRTSPASVSYAKIRANDLYTIEKRIKEVKDKIGELPKNLHLVIHTPGGELYASIKIAKYLQKVFGNNIQAFVPYEAASGGTILCLTANKIVMDAASNLTSIDPQVRYKGQTISVTSYEQALDTFKEEYGNLKPEEIPSPYQQLGSQFDPIIAKEMSKLASDTIWVAYKILKKSQGADKEFDLKLYRVALRLGSPDYPHSHVISVDEAKEFGLSIDESSSSLTLLMNYKAWVSAKLDEKQASHVIDIYYPNNKIKETKENKHDKQRKKK